MDGRRFSADADRELFGGSIHANYDLLIKYGLHIAELNFEFNTVLWLAGYEDERLEDGDESLSVISTDTLENKSSHRKRRTTQREAPR